MKLIINDLNATERENRLHNLYRNEIYNYIQEMIMNEGWPCVTDDLYLDSVSRIFMHIYSHTLHYYYSANKLPIEELEHKTEEMLIKIREQVNGVLIAHKELEKYRR